MEDAKLSFQIKNCVIWLENLKICDVKMLLWSLLMLYYCFRFLAMTLWKSSCVSQVFRKHLQLNFNNIVEIAVVALRIITEYQIKPKFRQ